MAAPTCTSPGARNEIDVLDTPVYVFFSLACCLLPSRFFMFPSSSSFPIPSLYSAVVIVPAKKDFFNRDGLAGWSVGSWDPRTRVGVSVEGGVFLVHVAGRVRTGFRGRKVAVFNIFAGGWLDGRGAISWWELCGKVSCTLRKREAFLLLTGFFDLGTKVMDLQNEL